MKEKYNKLLKRYINGCEYLKNNPEKQEKYLVELIKILDEMNRILKEIEKEEKITEKEMLIGF